MAYKVEIYDGSTTYTFPYTAPPKWSLGVRTEKDDTVYPALITKQVDTLTIDGHFADSTASNVTDDLDTLKALLFDRASPVERVSLIDSGSTTRAELKTTDAGGSHHQLVCTGFEPDADSPGHLANHWKGTLTFEGVIIKGDASTGIVKSETTLSYAFDQHGFETRTKTFRIQTAPGTAASGKAAAQALTLPGNNWIHTTNGDDAINYRVLDTADTLVEGESSMKEQALNFPANTNEYTVNLSTGVDNDRTEERWTIQAQANSLARARTVAAQAPAPGSYLKKTTTEERHRNRVTANYTVLADAGSKVESWSIFSQGGGGEKDEVRIPSSDSGDKVYSVPFNRPVAAIRMSESLTVSRVGNEDILVPTAFDGYEDFEDTHRGSDVSRIRERGSDATQHLYERRVQRYFVFHNHDKAPEPKDLLRAIKKNLVKDATYARSRPYQNGPTVP